MIEVTDLSGPWRLTGTGVDLPATVPGCVHVDLLDAGRIPDPFLDDNEKAVAWVGLQEWTYSRDISFPDAGHDRVDLVFDGLDTVADISLGGEPIGATRNMHRGYRFDVTSLLGSAPADLRVRFSSAYEEAKKAQAALGPRPNAYPEPFNFVRKMACSFGWDWGPTLVTAGIWRSVRLEAWSTARLSSVRPLATFVQGKGRLDLTVTVERTRETALSAAIQLDGIDIGELFFAAGATTASISVTVDALPWNPRGYGSAALHTLTISLGDSRGRPGDSLDRWERRIGFRTVDIDRTPDAVGTPFVFHINDAPVLVKGVNWIPGDIFPARMTRARYEQRLGEAAAAGVNLIRVWGGGIYESRDFYEVCDELGLMVWQDFLFACACYPEEEPLHSEVVAEARDNVIRLSPHPSLVAWNGNNENLWLRGASGWESQPGGDRSWGETYYLRTLPEIVAGLDPSRPYMAGSPWSGSWEHEPNSPDHETFHSWDVWNRQDYAHYRDSAPRFVAEFGWQAPPAWQTLRDAVSDDPLLPDSPGVLHHQKAEYGNGKLARGLAPHFPPPTSTEAWHYLTQLNQVRAVRTGIEHWRSHWPRTAGTILWQLNDLWPGTSWAAIDGAGRYKPLYFELAALYAGRALTFQPRAAGLVVAVLNDHEESWAGSLRLSRMDTAGTVLASVDISVDVPARSVSEIAVPPVMETPGTGSFLVGRLSGVRNLWFEEVDFACSDAGLSVTAETVTGGLDVRVTASRLARDVLLQADRLHPSAVVDRGFVTLLPGESTTFSVRAPVPLDAGLLDAPWVLTDLASVLSPSPLPR